MKFVWYRFRQVNRKAFGVLFGIVPEHQGTGVGGGGMEPFGGPYWMMGRVWV